MPTNSTSQPDSTSASQPHSTTWSSNPSSNLGLHALAVPRRRPEWANRTCPPNLTPLDWSQHTVRFCLNAIVLVLTVVAILPLGNRSLRAHRLAFFGTEISSVNSLYWLYREPPSGNLRALQVWFQSVVVAKDFIRTFTALFLPFVRASNVMALIPILVCALEHTAEFLRSYCSRSTLYRKYFEKACVWVELNITTISILSAQAEIGTGFLLIISLFSRWKDGVLVFIYWQLLRLMYNAPATARNHRNGWAKMVLAVTDHIPFLNSALSVVHSFWFG